MAASSTKRRIFISIIGFVVLLVYAVWWNFMDDRITDLPPVQPPATIAASTKTVAVDNPIIVSVAKTLEIPWALDFLPDGNIIFTERPGRVNLIDPKSGLPANPIHTINEVAHVGEAGLLGIAVHPDFALNRFIYVYYTYRSGKSLTNRVVRFRKQNNGLLDKTIIIDRIPGAPDHNGGRIKFGPDGFLYITTGDALIPDLAQDKTSLAGKILRISADGGIPENNPFPGRAVYSLGHRNPQGLAWDNQGNLWATEHGSSAGDELNLIKPGKNYGWPIIRGGKKAAGMTSPAIHSGRKTWAPSGAVFFNGTLFFTGLRGQSLYALAIKEKPLKIRRYFYKNFGRLRDVAVGPDNFIYLLTSNRDGRGIPAEADDQLIRVNLKLLLYRESLKKP